MKLPRALVPLFAALAAVLPATAGSPSDTSDKLAPLTWREQLGRVMLVVDAFPASFEGKQSYVPLRIAMAMTDKGAPVTIGPESFTLIDADGGSLPVASYPALPWCPATALLAVEGSTMSFPFILRCPSPQNSEQCMEYSPASFA
jgi:hypothetical protein